MLVCCGMKYNFGLIFLEYRFNHIHIAYIGNGVNDVIDGIGNGVDDMTGGNGTNGANGTTGAGAAGRAR